MLHFIQKDINEFIIYEGYQHVKEWSYHDVCAPTSVRSSWRQLSSARRLRFTQG